MSSIPNYILQGVILYTCGSVSFDIIHYLLHLCWNSKNKILKSIGYIHQTHHFYFNRRLAFNQKYNLLNSLLEFPAEFFSQLIGFLLAPRLFEIDHRVVLAVSVFALLRSVFNGFMDGMDSNHISYKGTVPKDNNFLIVGPEFHVLHHIYPDRYYSSFIRFFDWVFGTAYSLDGRRITVTGASGAFGSGLIKVLENENPKCIKALKYGVDYCYDDYSGVVSVLAETDVLILAHGSKVEDAMKANCESFVRLIEIFRKTRKDLNKRVEILPEVWAVGSEIEFHPAWGNRELQIYSESKREYARHAKGYFGLDDLVYRHIVPSAFDSRMGPGKDGIW